MKSWKSIESRQNTFRLEQPELSSAVDERLMKHEDDMYMQNRTSIKKSVLIVDNELLIARGVQSSLNSLDNITSYIALSADDAVRKASDVTPDLIIMDVKLKDDIDGLRAVKSIQERLDIPSIFLTTHSNAELLKKARETEPSAIIFKPYAERELICAVELAFRQSEREKELKEKVHLCLTALRSIGDAVIITDENGLVSFMNPAAEVMTGWKQEEASGIPIAEVFIIVNDKPGKRLADPFSKMLQEGVMEGFENYTELIAKDGTRKPILNCGAAIRDDRGHIAGIILSFKDYTEQKQIERALQESEKKYIDLYQNAPDGYHSLEADGTICEVNDTWLKMLGYERDEIERRINFTDLLSNEDLQKFQNVFSDFKKKGVTENVEYNLIKKNGSILPVLIGATAICDEKGNFLRCRCIVRDISTRVTYKHRLEQLVEEWRITFDSMPYGVLLLDSDFRIIRANKYVSKLFGISFEDMKDWKCYEIIRSDQLEKRSTDFKEYQIITLKSFEYYDERLHNYFMVYLTPIPDAGGITKAFTLALVDITEIKDKHSQLINSRNAFFNMLTDLDVAYKDLKGLYEGIIHSFVNAIDAKSPWTKGHSERVTKYALAIASEMGLHEDERDNLRMAALLHDIGKIGTCDMILDNPNRLTSEEMNCISVHPIKGEMILKPLKQLEILLPIIRYHHERIDGRGYPEGLKGNDIPLLSRIISVADSYDSMTSDRPYRSTLGDRYAISELTKHSGTQFDSQVVEAFLRVLKKDLKGYREALTRTGKYTEDALTDTSGI